MAATAAGALVSADHRGSAQPVHGGAWRAHKGHVRDLALVAAVAAGRDGTVIGRDDHRIARQIDAGERAPQHAIDSRRGGAVEVCALASRNRMETSCKATSRNPASREPRYVVGVRSASWMVVRDDVARASGRVG